MLKGILSISGHPGLFKMISQGKSSIIVESLDDGKRMPAYATSKISALEDIAIFTEEKEVPLETIFKSIFEKEKGQACLSHKSQDADIRKYFETILPEYDKNRVYVSDMKKVFSWYNQLIKHNLLVFKEEEKEPQVEAEVQNAKK